MDPVGDKRDANTARVSDHFCRRGP